MKVNKNYFLMTFYKFVDVKNPKEEVLRHKDFCSDIGIKGRIYIGEEGINAQFSCNKGQLQAYKLFLENSEYFKDIPDIDIKATPVKAHQFPKCIVRYRKEIVALGTTYKAEDVVKYRNKIPIQEFKSLMDKGEDNFVVLDMRNNYEYQLGHFKNAIPAGTVNFREVQDYIADWKKNFKDKQVVMYCTGGIRCEKLAVMFEKEGLSGVKQLDGGVVKYVNTFDDGNWLGNLYTFDDRVSTKVGDGETHTIISSCHYTNEPCETYHNCRYGPCNLQFIAKPKEYRKHMGFCSEECYHKAYEDLMIRDDKFDPMPYKDLRIQVKLHPEKKTEVEEQIRVHLKKWLKGVEFKHKKPVDYVKMLEYFTYTRNNKLFDVKS